jgi:hypothetical protein
MAKLKRPSEVTVAAFIDFYGLKYALLENAFSMASKVTRSRDENVP